MPRRNERDLFYLILSDCMKERTPVEIQAHAMISITEIRILAEKLKKRKLLKERKKSTVKTGQFTHFKTTKKGARYVKLYAQLLEPLKGFKSYAS